MFSSLFSLCSLLLLALSYFANAVPVNGPTELIAFAPTITSPTAGAIWNIGSVQTVSWLTSNVPPEARNYTVVVLLGYFTANSSSEHLDIKHPLASQVPIMQGSVNVTVPNVTPRCNYTAVVIGDSGDTSPQFTITH